MYMCGFGYMHSAHFSMYPSVPYLYKGVILKICSGLDQTLVASDW